mmetsp:Transcript_29204/g.93522  ORF Transcript_29204/g.93522 Transcript_29204/m.93522 type:complete len:255 (-) Transcript_29204:123-887(-)
MARQVSSTFFMNSGSWMVLKASSMRCSKSGDCMTSSMAPCRLPMSCVGSAIASRMKSVYCSSTSGDESCCATSRNCCCISGSFAANSLSFSGMLTSCGSIIASKVELHSGTSRSSTGSLRRISTSFFLVGFRASWRDSRMSARRVVTVSIVSCIFAMVSPSSFSLKPAAPLARPPAAACSCSDSKSAPLPFRRPPHCASAAGASSATAMAATSAILCSIMAWEGQGGEEEGVSVDVRRPAPRAARARGRRLCYC